MSDKLTSLASQFGVGAVAAAATAPIANQWLGLAISCATITVSVLLSGFVQHWLTRSASKNEDAQANRFSELSQGEHLKNTTRILDMKETEIRTLLAKIERLEKQVNEMREEIASLKHENAQLTMLLGSKLKELIQVQSLKSVFEAISKVEEMGEKTDE